MDKPILSWIVHFGARPPVRKLFIWLMKYTPFARFFVGRFGIFDATGHSIYFVADHFGSKMNRCIIFNAPQWNFPPTYKDV